MRAALFRLIMQLIRPIRCHDTLTDRPLLFLQIEPNEAGHILFDET
jgi:hypothetical protein